MNKLMACELIMQVRKQRTHPCDPSIGEYRDVGRTHPYIEENVMLYRVGELYYTTIQYKLHILRITTKRQSD
jgi:hypothetical protein